MIQLTPEQRQIVAQRLESPPRARDPDTQITYVLVREDVYERAKALLTQEDEQFVEDMYPHVMEVFGRAGWDDPAMDVQWPGIFHRERMPGGTTMLHCGDPLSRSERRH